MRRLLFYTAADQRDKALAKVSDAETAISKTSAHSGGLRAGMAVNYPRTGATGPSKL
jgi:hypothetical protein